jgi:hypothetical protein
MHSALAYSSGSRQLAQTNLRGQDFPNPEGWRDSGQAETCPVKLKWAAR